MTGELPRDQWAPLQAPAPSRATHDAVVDGRPGRPQWIVLKQSRLGGLHLNDRLLCAKSPPTTLHRTSGLPRSTGIAYQPRHVAKVPTPEIAGFIRSLHLRAKGRTSSMRCQGFWPFRIHHQFQVCWQLNGQFRGLCTTHDLARHPSCLADRALQAHTVSEQAPGPPSHRR